jgi:hypothetical protein
MRTSRSSRRGKAHAAAVLALSSLTIAACSGIRGEPAPVSISPVYGIAGAPAAGMSGPVVAEIRPAAAQGELRFVVVPPDQAVR